MKPAVRKCASIIDTDIDLVAKWDARDADACVNRCVAAATQSLKSDTPRLKQEERAHLHQILTSLRHSHQAVRELLKHEAGEPLSVSVMPIVRAEIETLYSLCLIIEQPSTLTEYLKDGWKKLFVRHRMMELECPSIPRVIEGLAQQSQWIDQMQIASQVSDLERQTIEADELDIPLPAGTAPVRIQQFPTPSRVIERVAHPSRRQMLLRLYPEYSFLCGFVHFSPATVILSSLLDTRQPFRKLFTTGQIEEMYQKEIVGPAMWLDVLSIVQSCAEFVEIYRGDIELVRACTEGWRMLSQNAFIGKVIWNLRTKELLGALA